MRPSKDRNIRYEITPAAEKLDKLDLKEEKLERDFKAKVIGVDEYATAKHALIIQRRKVWATMCRAMGWPLEYNPLTYDPDYITPANDVESVGDPPEDRSRSRLHYKIFAGWVVLLLALYWWLGG